jgi:hypothetical protein
MESGEQLRYARLDHRSKVDHFTKDGKQAYPGGSVIVAEQKNGKPVYSVDGKEIGLQDFEMFSAVLESPGSDNAISTDKSLGTDKPQKVGDTWTINSEASAQDIIHGINPNQASRHDPAEDFQFYHLGDDSARHRRLFPVGSAGRPPSETNARNFARQRRTDNAR